MFENGPSRLATALVSHYTPSLCPVKEFLIAAVISVELGSPEVVLSPASLRLEWQVRAKKQEKFVKAIRRGGMKSKFDIF
jgi:hypothetical protein